MKQIHRMKVGDPVVTIETAYPWGMDITVENKGSSTTIRLSKRDAWIVGGAIQAMSDDVSEVDE